jgi:H+-transporting ATPase
MPATESAPPSKSVGAVDVGLQDGLTTSEAHRPLEKFGANAMPDTSMHPLRVAIEKLWAPVPWMLEAAIILEVVLGKYVEAAIISFDIQCCTRAVPGEPRVFARLAIS